MASPENTNESNNISSELEESIAANLSDHLKPDILAEINNNLKQSEYNDTFLLLFYYYNY